MDLATDELCAARQELDRLDGAIGDGDHGSSVSRSFATAREALPPISSSLAMTGPGDVLTAFGQRLLERGVGASGSLYGVLFSSLGESLPAARAANLAELATATEAAFRAVSEFCGAGLGSATLLDALWPFADSLRESSSLALPLTEALSRAAEAAAVGATRTAEMVPKAGRARSYGASALGHPDPGASSMALIARAVAVAVADDAG